MLIDRNWYLVIGVLINITRLKEDFDCRGFRKYRNSVEAGISNAFFSGLLMLDL